MGDLKSINIEPERDDKDVTTQHTLSYEVKNDLQK